MRKPENRCGALRFDLLYLAFRYDSSKPDVTARKLRDVSRIHALGWRPKIALEHGVRSTYDWCSAHLGVVRE
jgi:nucleoside-diphosphate-sugar epimerase